MRPTEMGKERRKKQLENFFSFPFLLKALQYDKNMHYGKYKQQKQTKQKHVLDASGSDTLT